MCLFRFIPSLKNLYHLKPNLGSILKKRITTYAPANIVLLTQGFYGKAEL
jgi:hypothetical protein